MTNVDTLNVFSFNCWGLALVAKHREFRLKAIAEAISRENFDIVTLQEVWVKKDLDYIVESVKQKLPYFKYFYSGALGSGLVILSRFPIISTSYHRFALNGWPLKVFHGDYYVGKGVGSALVDHPVLGLLEIFNTHLHAGYGPKDRYRAHRATECWQLAYLLRNSASMGRHIILSGDFNSVPSSFNYHLICDHGFMCDSWLQVHGQPDAAKFDMDHLTSDSFTQFFGYTCNSPFNTFSRYYKGGMDNARQLLGKRLDYIFYHYSPQMECVSSQVVFTDNIPNTTMSYSDHFGVLSIFKVSARNESIRLDTMAPLPSLIAHPNYTHLSSTMLEEILEAIEKDQKRAKLTGTKLLRYFCLFVVLWMIMYVIVVVLPSTLSQFSRLPIILVTIFGGLLMTAITLLIPVCLIVGFVFGRTEQRTLLQFYNEIETFKQNRLDRDTSPA